MAVQLAAEICICSAYMLIMYVWSKALRPFVMQAICTPLSQMRMAQTVKWAGTTGMCLFGSLYLLFAAFLYL